MKKIVTSIVALVLLGSVSFAQDAAKKEAKPAGAPKKMKTEKKADAPKEAKADGAKEMKAPKGKKAPKAAKETPATDKK
jgi:hypothetical protein